MEEQEDFQIQKLSIKRKVSLFKKRKKPNIRSFVKETKQKKFKTTILRLLFLVLIIFSIVGVLWYARFFLIPSVFENSHQNILKPVDVSINPSDIKKEISSSGLDIEDIKVSNDLTEVSFKIHREVLVLMDPRNDIKKDLEVLKAIDDELIQDRKRAMYIDLRYSKPIVKMQ